MNIQRELEKDGISGALYHLLWVKNEAFQNTLKLNIPDTIIYFNAKPIFWYYSTKDGLKKKKKENITNDNIYEYFRSIDQNISVSAVFLFNDHENTEKKITCKYMDLQQLKEFLNDESKPNEGILQRFILPFGINNCMIQVIWGQKICVFSKRINKRNIYDKKLDLYERCCTFDGADHYSENVPVKGHLSKFLKEEIQKIVNHIADISFEKFMISRMLLFIKEDIKGKIWILWANSLRIEGSARHKAQANPMKTNLNFLHLHNKPLSLQTSISLPRNIDPLFSTNTLHPQNIQKKVHCLRCNQPQHDRNFIEVPYKLLIKEHDHKIRKEDEFFNIMKTYALNPIEVRNANEEENEILRNLKKSSIFYIKSDNDKIPVLIRRLHPRLSNKEYLEIKGLMEFQQHQIPICQDCYMELIQYLQYAGGQDFLLETIRFQAKKQTHKSADLTIKQLEKLKKPFYHQNKQMPEGLKGVCSHYRQKKCAGMQLLGESQQKSKESQKHKTFHGDLMGSSMSLSRIMTKQSDEKEHFNKEVNQLVEKYLDLSKDSAFKRLEQRIKPIVLKEKKTIRGANSLHSVKMSLDSTHFTNINNKE